MRKKSALATRRREKTGCNGNAIFSGKRKMACDRGGMRRRDSAQKRQSRLKKAAVQLLTYGGATGLAAWRSSGEQLGNAALVLRNRNGRRNVGCTFSIPSSIDSKRPGT